jgi:hypothetical protein
VEVIMRRRAPLLLLLPLALGSCNSAGFGAVSTVPIYGYDDGCTPLTIRGHGFADDATAQIGGADVTNIAPLEAGFEFTGNTPPGATGDFADVTVTSDGETSTIPKGWYYLACPLTAAGTEAPNAETATPSDSVTAGTEITLTGCNLAAGTYQVQIGDAAPVALTSVCGEGVASFTAPDLPDGAYAISFLSASGDLVYPMVTCDAGGDTAGGDTSGGGGDTAADTDTDAGGDTSVDTADTADTGFDTAIPPCDAQLVITYGAP